MAQRDPHVGFQKISNTEDADQISVSGEQAQFGQGGSDDLTFSGTSPVSPGLALGGRSSDTYVVNAGENGGVFDGFGSSGDRLEMPGISFQNAVAAQIDGRHLWVGSADGATNVVIFDWRDSDHRIESFSFGGGQSLSYAEATAAIDSGIDGYLGDLSLEQALSQAQVDIGIDAEAIRNAVSYYDHATPPSPSEEEPNPAADGGDAGEAPQDAGDTFTTATVVDLPHKQTQDVGGADPADVYAFTPSQTTELSATVRDPSDGLSPSVEIILHVPDGMGEGSSGTAEELTITRNVTAGKTYYLEVQPENGGGAYELDLQVDTAGLDEHGDSAASATALEVGDRPRGELFPAADQDWYAVEIQARQTYTFSTYSAGQVHPDLTLVRPDGATEVVSREASDGLERVAEIAHQPLASGTYYLRVASDTPNESGVYTLFTEASEAQPSGPSIDLSTADGRAKAIAAVYVAYYDRAPDPSGLAHWLSELEDVGSQAGYREALTKAANGFAGAQETREVYTLPGEGPVARSDLEAFVSSVYDHIFGRSPEEAGLQYWSDRLADGTQPGSMVLEILLAAEGDDVAAIDNKIAAGLAYTDLLKNGDAEYDITVGREVIDRAGMTSEALEAAKIWAQEQVETVQNQQALAIETTLDIEPETTQPGDEIETDIVVRNIGDATAERGYIVTYFLSEDQRLDGDDRELAEDDGGFGGNFGIEPGQEQGFDSSFRIPANINTGDYRLLVEIQTKGTDVSWLRSLPLTVSDQPSTLPGSGTSDDTDDTNEQTTTPDRDDDGWPDPRSEEDETDDRGEDGESKVPLGSKLANGGKIEGEVERAGQALDYPLFLFSDTAYTFSVDAAGSAGEKLDPAVEVKKGLRVVAENDDRGWFFGIFDDNAEVEFTPTESQRYTLSVLGEDDTIGTFEVTMSYSDDFGNLPANAEPVDIGETRQLRADAQGDSDWFKVDLDAGENYRFDLSASSERYGKFALLDEDLNRLAQKNNGDPLTDLSISGEAGYSGTHYLVVGQQVSAPQTFTLSTQKAESPERAQRVAAELGQSDAPDNRAAQTSTVQLQDAGESGPSAGRPVVFSGTVGGSDDGDYYRLIVPDDGYSIEAELRALTDNLKLKLGTITGVENTIISDNSGNETERIDAEIGEGSAWFLAVEPSGLVDLNSSDYELEVGPSIAVGGVSPNLDDGL